MSPIQSTITGNLSVGGTTTTINSQRVLIKNNTISGRIAKEVFELMINDNRDPKVIVEEKGLVQESNVGELEKIIEKVLKDNTDKVAEYKSGKDKLFGFFVGSVIKESKGKANPALVNDILKKKLS